jgi:hypothetical protein
VLDEGRSTVKNRIRFSVLSLNHSFSDEAIASITGMWSKIVEVAANAAMAAMQHDERQGSVILENIRLKNEVAELKAAADRSRSR